MRHLRKAHKLSLIVLTTFIISCSSNQVSDTTISESCQDLNKCLEKINTITESKYGISKEARLLAEKIASFGQIAVPELVKRLASQDLTELKITGYALGQIQNIDEKYLPEIILGVKKDIPWLARALGNIQSDAAANAALNAYLNTSSSPHNQEAAAVVKQQHRVIPFIIKETTYCFTRESTQKNYLLKYIVSEMNESVKQNFAKEIIQQLENSRKATNTKKCLLTLLYEMGKPGRVIEESLVSLKKTQPSLTDQIDFALIGIHSKYSVSIYINLLKETPSPYIIRNLAELGLIANEAGPVLIDLLQHNDREVQFEAARTLGHIQYRNAERYLISLLSNARDIQLSGIAAASLGMLRQKSSIKSLTKTSNSYWFPPVRNTAKKAIEHIKNGKKSKTHKERPPFDFFYYQNFQIENCNKIGLEPANELPSVKLYKNLHHEKLKELEYDSHILSYGASDEEEQREGNPDDIIEVTPNNIVEHKENIKQIPDTALRVTNGWLAGSSRGEWGGELVFIPEDGPTTTLLNDNIEGIYQLGDSHIAVAGLAHLGLNTGTIYKIKKNNDTWQITPWISLPGAPDASWLVETGELLINTYGAGSILLSSQGEFRMAPCSKD